MTRLFYTDPLAAAWMATHHGMLFDIPDGHPAGGADEVALLSHLGIGRFDIHQGSLSLLEPKPKDIVFYAFGFFHHKGEVWDEVKAIIRHNDEGYPYTGNGEAYVLTDGGDSFGVSRLNRIIQRNGIPFMWPESEAA